MTSKYLTVTLTSICIILVSQLTLADDDSGVDNRIANTITGYKPVVVSEFHAGGTMVYSSELSNGKEYISCSTSAQNTLFCFATDGIKNISCASKDRDFVDLARSIDSMSHILFSVSRLGNKCTFLNVLKSSKHY